MLDYKKCPRGHICLGGCGADFDSDDELMSRCKCREIKIILDKLAKTQEEEGKRFSCEYLMPPPL